MESKNAIRFTNISDLFRQMGMPAPGHPLIALVNYELTPMDLIDAGKWFVLDFYKITFKRTFSGKVNYGPGSYDFKEGGMAFLGPNQVVQKSAEPDDYQGYALYFHPDMLKRYPLNEKISGYGYFSYAVSEALFLSEQEKETIQLLFQSIYTELANPIDTFSADVLVAQLELLLTHSNRYYNRQFLSRQHVHNDLIEKMNHWLNNYFDNNTALMNGLPSPQEISGELAVSQRYLSDLLKTLTGKTTQEHIHLKLIEKAKELIVKKRQNTAEIAFQLGFEHPQSFNKLFKQKTGLSPAEFRDQARIN